MMALEIALENYESWKAGLQKSGASWYWKKHAFDLDRTELLAQLDNFRSTESKPLSDTLDDYRSKMSMQTMLDELSMHVPEKIIEELLENKIGNPPSEIVSARSGKLLSATFNDLVLLSFVTKIKSALTQDPKDGQLRVIEIGGGYGGLSAKLKKLFPLAKITIIDLPHAGLLQAYYLNQALPMCRLEVIPLQASSLNKSSNDSTSDFRLIPSTRLDLIQNEEFELVVNTRSFMEMDRKTIHSYFDFIQRTLRVGGVFFNCNRIWKNAGDRPTQISKYPYDKKWQLVSLGTSFFQNNTIEIMARRTSVENPIFLTIVSRLPRTDYLIHGNRIRGFVELIRPSIPAVFTLTYWKRIRKYH